LHPYDLLAVMFGGFRERRFIIKAVTFAIAMAAPTLSSHLTLNQLNPIWDAVTLLAIGANLAVWYGVSLENEHNPEGVKHAGWRVVVAFLLVETWSGWALWQVDTAISDKKDAQIIALQAADTRRDLTPEQQQVIANKMRAWAKLPKGFSRQSVAVFSTNGLFESAHLADEIAAALGPGKAEWNVNRYPVTMGVPLTVSGVGMFASSNARGQAIASALADALNSVGIAAFVMPQRWKGCEDEKITPHPESEPFCSGFSIEVGDHP